MTGLYNIDHSVPLLIKFEKLNICGIKVNRLAYKLFISYICESVELNFKRSIAYSNTHIIHLAAFNDTLKTSLDKFDLIHPDGIGIYFASKFLYRSDGLEQRITGSDFYYDLIKKAKQENWRIFFLGHDKETFEKIKSQHPELNITGHISRDFSDDKRVINSINNSASNIIIVGLQSPFQEKWIAENQDKLNCNIILAVGGGIKVFANTLKRGPEVIRMLGLEWLYRLITNPKWYWKRILVGFPVFIALTLKQKSAIYKNKKENLVFKPLESIYRSILNMLF